MAVLVFVAGRFGADAGQVVVAASGHADVEMLGAGGPVDDEHALVDGESLSFVDGHGVGAGYVLLGVVAGQRDDAAGEGVFDAVAVEDFDKPGEVVRRLRNCQWPSWRRARSAANSSSQAKAASRESIRRPSSRMVTSSGVGGAAWRSASANSSAVKTGFAATAPGYRRGWHALGAAADVHGRAWSESSSGRRSRMNRARRPGRD